MKLTYPDMTATSIMTEILLTGLPATIMDSPEVLPPDAAVETYSFSQHHDGTCSHMAA